MPSPLAYTFTLSVLSLFFLPLTTLAEPHADTMKGAELFLARDIKWQEAPASLPKGALMALLEGNLTKEGPFVVRIKFPDGYRIMPHTHPKRERVTVLSGILNIGMGEVFDQKTARAMPAGTYGSWQEGMKHFGWATGETVIQIHGMGPWSIQYVNPDDDPRNKK